MSGHSRQNSEARPLVGFRVADYMPTPSTSGIERDRRLQRARSSSLECHPRDNCIQLSDLVRRLPDKVCFSFYFCFTYFLFKFILVYLPILDLRAT